MSIVADSQPVTTPDAKSLAALERDCLLEELAKERQRLERVVEERERAEIALRLLAEASKAFSASGLDYQATLDAVTRLIARETGDTCVIALLSDDGRWLTRAAQHQSSPPGARREHEEPESHPAVEGLAGAVVSTGQAMLIPSLVIVPLRTNGRAMGTLSVGRDRPEQPFTESDGLLIQELADRAALAIANARLYKRAQEINRIKDEFLSTVSHELRTPLNAILGWAHMLRTVEMPPEKFTRALETIERNAQTQAQMVNDLLDASRIITGKLRLEMGPVDLPMVVEAALESLRPAGQGKGIELEVSIDRSIGLVTGDSTRLQQIVWHLASNAIKFTPAGGRAGVSLERAGADIAIIVADTGQGISASFLPFVFDRFRQADGTITRRHGGLGLGLAIVRHLVELHGGTVHAESPGEGKGATFTVRLPPAIEKDRGRHGELALGAMHEELQGVTVEDLPTLDRLEVLIVDDELDTLEMLKEVLLERGAKVRAASNAADALSMLESWKPDVLVSDIGMPDQDGYAFIRQVRAQTSKNRWIPAVALTAYARSEDRLRALTAGFQVHVSKPVHPGELTAVIANLALSSQSLREP